MTPERIRAEIDRREAAAGGDAAAAAGAGDPDLAAIETPALVQTMLDQERAIYGVDDRKDHFQVDDVRMSERCDSVAALFLDQHVVDLGDGRSKLATTPLADAFGLCPQERLGRQPCGAFCTGFVVGRDIIATAAHCFLPKHKKHPDRVRVVFGFRMVGLGQPALLVDNRDVYTATAIMDGMLTKDATDWALIRVDRPIDTQRHPVLPIRPGKIGDGEPVYVIGHPCGLPVKIADGAQVRDNEPAAFFTANLDTYGGNSGSPVFDAEHRVAGILVRGATDFVFNGDCRVSTVFPTTGGRGEDCTRPDEFLPALAEALGAGGGR